MGLMTIFYSLTALGAFRHYLLLPVHRLFLYCLVVDQQANADSKGSSSVVGMSVAMVKVTRLSNGLLYDIFVVPKFWLLGVMPQYVTHIKNIKGGNISHSYFCHIQRDDSTEPLKETLRF
jgi:hypothetical protein